MKSWRPKEGWKNPFDETIDWRNEKFGIRHRDYEAGADAILKGIKEELDKAFNDNDRLIILQRIIE